MQDLFVFPHAGGSAAMFRNWPKALPPTLRVNALQLAGRESRYHETPTSDWREVVQGAAEAIAASHSFLPLLFGHSMGAILAYEVARELRRRYDVQVGALLVSGRPAPHLPGRTPGLTTLSDQELLASLSVLYGGIPPEVLKDSEMVRIMARVLRADLTLVQEYDYGPDERLTCPLASFGGVSDPWATRNELAGWKEVTTGSFSLEMFVGGHFYLRDQSTEPLLLRSVSLLCTSLTGSVQPQGTHQDTALR